MYLRKIFLRGVNILPGAWRNQAPALMTIIATNDSSKSCSVSVNAFDVKYCVVHAADVGVLNRGRSSLSRVILRFASRRDLLEHKTKCVVLFCTRKISSKPEFGTKFF